METTDIKNEVTREKLRVIKGLISSCGFKLDYGKCLDIDEIFNLKIKGLLNNNKYSNDLLEILKNNSNNGNNNINTILSMYYFSLYNESTEMLNLLVKNGFKFKNHYGQFDLFTLDRNFTDYFNKQDFINLLRTDSREMSIFYRRCFLSYRTNMDGERKSYLITRMKHINDNLFLNDNIDLNLKKELVKEARIIAIELKNSYVNDFDSDLRDKCTKQFVNIINTKPDICKRKNADDDMYHGLLTPEVILLFGKDIILKLTDRQKNILCTCFTEKDLDCANRLKHILKKYPKYSNTLPLTKYVMDNFTDKELYEMNEFEMEMYRRAININELTRVKKLYLSGVIFGEGNVPIVKELFDALSDEDIINLTPKEKLKINELYSFKKRLNSKSDEDILKCDIRNVLKKESFFGKVKKIIS